MYSIFIFKLVFVYLILTNVPLKWHAKSKYFTCMPKPPIAEVKHGI